MRRRRRSDAEREARHLEPGVRQDDHEQPAQVADLDPVCAARPDRRPDEDAQRDRPGDVRVDLAAQKVDHGALRRGDADHQVAGRGRGAQRNAHEQVHRRAA